MRHDVRGRHRLRGAARPGRRRHRVPVLRRARRPRAAAATADSAKGLTSRILMSREPLLLNQAASSTRSTAHGRRNTGPRPTWASRSLSGDEAIGVISVQSTQQRGPLRRSRRPTARRRSRRTSASRSRTPACTTRPSAAPTRWRRWPSRPRDLGDPGPDRGPRAASPSTRRTLLVGGIERGLPGRARRTRRSARSSRSVDMAEQVLADTITSARASSAASSPSREAEVVNDVLADPRTRDHPGHRPRRRTSG